MLTITFLKRIVHERRAIPRPLARGIDTDDWQIPMRASRPISGHLFQHPVQIGANSIGHRGLHYFSQGDFIGLNIWAKPEAHCGMVVAAVGTFVCERVTSKRSDEAR